MFRHYTTISMATLAMSDVNVIYGRVIRAVHLHNHSVPSDQRIAVAFPDIREGEDTEAGVSYDTYGSEQRAVRSRRGTLGRTVRLFSPDKAALDRLMRDLPWLHGQAEIVGPILVENVDGMAVYEAHKGMTNKTPSRLRRAIRRGNVKVKEIQKVYALAQQAARDTSLPNLTVESKSTGAMFTIFIAARDGQNGDGVPNTYGFSSPKSSCPVPVIR